MALHISSRTPIQYTLDGVLYSSGKHGCIPSTATAAVIFPLLLRNGIRLVAIPGKRYVRAESFKLDRGRC